ncbi:hypothetical protein [Heyndrickxia sporothermodurans]|uniref:hypothetical protein n=1 Tax=Heyndrickxia sporothermodurans TaxID=46224 RepID=UPI002E1D1201|nr:hypothetical protein [Heyndrickxia sporothermodurans]
MGKEIRSSSTRNERIRAHGKGNSFLIYPHQTDSCTWERKLGSSSTRIKRIRAHGNEIRSSSTRNERIRAHGNEITFTIFPNQTDSSTWNLVFFLHLPVSHRSVRYEKEKQGHRCLRG